MKNKGFTLIEIMLVVAIIGILASIAIPAFSSYLQKSKRSDAIVALQTLQQEQAKLRANCRWYGETIAGTTACAASAAASTIKMVNAASGIATSEGGYYTIEVTADSATGNSYIATATARGAQLGDNNCRVFVLTVNGGNPNGAKSSLDSSGNASTGCW